MIQVPVSVLESQSEHNLDCGIRHDDVYLCPTGARAGQSPGGCGEGEHGEPSQHRP